jgi:chemotaxis regulatin CheY-phosphate phosphatase CheZ
VTVHRPADLSDDEFDQIEERLSETPKGRAFLRRYARRSAAMGVDEVRTIVADLRDMISGRGEGVGPAGHMDVLRRELMEMAASIERARREIASLRPADETASGNSKILTATNELDAIVSSTERASIEILNSAERLMELVSKLRRTGADSEICSDIESEVTGIFTACSFQDITGQRTSKVVNALRYIEQRVAAMIGIWGIEGIAPNEDDDNADRRPDAHLLGGPQLDGMGVSQDDIDRMLNDDNFAVVSAPAEPEWDLDPPPAPPPPPPPPPAKKAKKAAEEPPPKAEGKALDQSAIDALFG